MKKLFLSAAIIFLTTLLVACGKKDATVSSTQSPYGNGPRTPVPAELQGNWMYGQFSMTEYWSTDPSTYIGNAFEMAIAFTFHADGTFEQYFTSRTAANGISTYHQSLTKGTVEIDVANQKIITHAHTAHYKRTSNGVTQEDRDMTANEITALTNYTYTVGTEPNGTKAIYLKLNGTGNALSFLQRF